MGGTHHFKFQVSLWWAFFLALLTDIKEVLGLRPCLIRAYLRLNRAAALDPLENDIDPNPMFVINASNGCFSNRAFGSSSFLIFRQPGRSRGSRFSSQSVGSFTLGVAACMHGIRVWKASLCDALEAQQTLTASSIPSSAWDDPAKIEFEGSVKSCRCLRSEPELCAVDPHPMKHDGNLAGDSDDGSPPSLGLQYSRTCLVPCRHQKIRIDGDRIVRINPLNPDVIFK